MSIWNEILRRVNNSEKVALMYVIDSAGSSPGRQGFVMVVNNRGEMAGSIGGGIMEQKLVELAKSKLQPGRFEPFIKTQIHRKTESNQSGMICSGEQTIAFYCLDQTHKSLIIEICNCFDEGDVGILKLTEQSIVFSKEPASSSPGSKFDVKAQSWTAYQLLGYPNHIYILGGGHVGLALSMMMRQIGFYVEIFDDREGLNTMERNTAAHKKHYVDYAELAGLIPEGNHVYVAIVSFGYRTDKAVLKTLIGKKYKYLGMMGSDAKVETVLEELAEEGASKEFLKTVHTPIGLPIRSKTPEEIAVSIAAEIISVANNGQ
jgi:xanthine dehydrogenase accessory factor